jgi:hypothetical protein
MKPSQIDHDALPEIAAAVATKALSLDEAYRLAGKPQDEQRSLFQRRLAEGQSAHRAARKGRSAHEGLVKHLRQHKVPPLGADPRAVASAYFEIANDACLAGQLVLSLVNRSPHCMNEQGLVQLVATANQLVAFIREHHPHIDLQGKRPV